MIISKSILKATKVTPTPDVCDSSSEAGAPPGAMKQCKFTGVRSTDPDPLYVRSGTEEIPCAPWSRHDANGNPMGRQSELSRRICFKYYKNRSFNEVFAHISSSAEAKAQFDRYTTSYISATQQALTFRVRVPV